MLDGVCVCRRRPRRANSKRWSAFVVNRPCTSPSPSRTSSRRPNSLINCHWYISIYAYILMHIYIADHCM